jgi:hypothetical protein
VVLEQHSAGTLTVNKLFLEKTEDAIKKPAVLAAHA